MPKVLIADDHPVVRTGLRQIIADEPDIEIVGEASNGNEVIEFIKQNPCDMVLLDIAMPERSGLDIISEVRQLSPETRILILSIYPEDQYAVRALRAGASGYLTKSGAPQELLVAIHKILAGGRYISPSLAEILATEIDRRSTRHPHEQLSDREYQVMLMLASGKTVTEAAHELELSVKTISTYRSRILDKMNMKNNAQLTFYAMENHLLD